ncbi:MAG: hemolysin family protein [Ruminococcus sp.]
MDIFLILLLQVVLIALNAIFASAEIAVLSINETKLERLSDEGNRRAKRLFKLTREPAKFLATIQVAITLSGFLGSAFAADNFSGPLVDRLVSLGVPFSRGTLDSIAVVLITLILSYFTLIFGELVPKRLAMQKSESIAMGISGLVSVISLIFKPIVWFLSVSTNLVLRLFGIDPNQDDNEVSEEEILMMVDAGSEKGAIEHQEKEFIENVFEFNDITAGDITTHRTDVTALWTKDSDEEWAEIIHKNRHTLFPVCDGSADNIIGILNAKDYFRLDDKSRESVLKNAVKPAYFVPETIKADVLFRNMKSTRNTFAVVIDEYGGMEGIVTLFDLIEELVGDLHDECEEPDNPDPVIEKLDSHSFKLSGNVRLSDLEEATGVTLESEDYDTLTGLVFGELGTIPRDGVECLDVDLGTLTVHITEIFAHQIKSATVTVKDSSL